MGWNFGDIIDGVASALAPGAPAFIHDGRVITWAEATKATNNLARALLARGVEPGSRIAIYMRNRPEYLLTLAAGWKSRLTHVNVNYRYTAPEVSYILDNADSQTVVFSSEFRPVIETIQPSLPGVRAWIEVCDDGETSAFSERFDCLCEAGSGEPLDIARAPDDQFFIYTGGTTGMPKGVVWTHDDLREIMLAGARRLGAVPETVEALIDHVRNTGPGPRTLPAPPLMHGTGLLTAISAMLAGGSVVTLTSPSFNPDEMLKAIDRWRPQTLAIVGDAFAKPLLNALEAAPDQYDLSSVIGIASSGVMWSREVKRGLLAHMPDAVLQDGFSASEAIGLGASIMTRDVEVSTAKFVIGDRCRVFAPDDRPVEPGSGVPGLIAVGPPNPLGYHKDAEKTARTFRHIDGVRFSFPGDWCLVEADGSLTLLGRGSACINTAGEKVFPEEVEEVLKTHPSVEDCLVVGLPDDKWGQSVTGIVKLSAGAVLDHETLRAHVRGRLAGYKTPKRIVATVEDIRSSNGKADYAKARSIAELALALHAPLK
jgi:acyl-CoA synthetase (AMP-forming)/AMP-acid ligase II